MSPGLNDLFLPLDLLPPDPAGEGVLLDVSFPEDAWGMSLEERGGSAGIVAGTAPEVSFSLAPPKSAFVGGDDARIGSESGVIS